MPGGTTFYAYLSDPSNLGVPEKVKVDRASYEVLCEAGFGQPVTAHCELRAKNNQFVLSATEIELLDAPVLRSVAN